MFLVKVFPYGFSILNADHLVSVSFEKFYFRVKQPSGQNLKMHLFHVHKNGMCLNIKPNKYC